MLRNKRAVSAPDDFTGTTTFRPVLPDPEPLDAAKVDRVLLCSGKITWELLAERTKRSDDHTAILPVEQLYPLPAQEVAAELAKYPGVREVRWVQDEPENMGPWPFMALHLAPRLPDGLTFRPVTRPASTSPAVGNHNVHLEQQKALHDAAFA
jgi:2-oxoglutarate decarboxylase